MKDFGSVVKQARLEKKLTLNAVAEKIGSHKGYVSGFENHKVNPPSARMIKKLARLLKLDELELMILAVAEKAPREIRDMVREGALAVYEARLKAARPAPPTPTQAAAG